MQQQARTSTSSLAANGVPDSRATAAMTLTINPSNDSGRLAGMSIKETGRMFSLPEQVMVQSSADEGKSK